uniref:Uncharacterized protein n=1 Tax=Mola mola TaxID=94237 RepID=A0A3Q4ARJ6_MOLML
MRRLTISRSLGSLSHPWSCKLSVQVTGNVRKEVQADKGLYILRKNRQSCSLSQAWEFLQLVLNTSPEQNFFLVWCPTIIVTTVIYL